MAIAEGTTSATSSEDTNGVRVAGTRAQTAVIYDVLSEGPIEGLVDGVASIRLNDNPVANTVNKNKISPQISYDVNYVASTGVVTDNNSQNMFGGASTSDGIRQVLITGGKKRSTNSINTVAGNNIIISSNTSNIAFASSDEYTGNVSGMEPLVRIDGAGKNGGQLVAGVTEFINTSAIRVDTTPMTTISNTAIYMDYVANVSSFSGNTATITAGGLDSSNVTAILSSPTYNPHQQPVYNYQNFGYGFRTGEREQEYMPTPKGIGSASVAFQVSGGNLGTTAGTGYPGPTGGGNNFDFSGGHQDYTGNALIVTSSEMGVGNPGEVDTLKATIAFNSMISQKENGRLGNGFAEYRITFGYSRDGGSTYTDVVKVGRANVSGRANYKANGEPRGYSNGKITAKSKQPFNQVFTIDISQYQPFDAYRLKFERISAVNQKENSWQQTNAGVIKQIENIITDKLTYPYSAYAAIVVDAEDFQQIPKRGYEIRGMKVKVPTNYFPFDAINPLTGVRATVASYTRNVITGADTGTVQDWDGNFRGDKKVFTDPTDPNYESVYCSNPIWVFYDLLTNQRYGLGKYLDEDFDFSQIDKYTLFQLAKYCDELVPDGKGGTEPRFTCNLYISKSTNAIKMLKNLASMVRSMLVWYNGQVTLGSNIQKGPVYAFNKSNVIEGQFGYSGTAGRFKHNQIAVTWNDPDNGYKQAVEVVEDHDEIARTGKIRRKDVTAYGCTSQGQAIRHGKYQLYTEKLEQEVVSFSTGLNGAMLKPGDVISVQDSDLTNITASGRVTTSSASSSTVIKTDRDITSYLNNDDTFRLNLIFPSGGCYIAQPLATINSVTYQTGDVVLFDEDGNAIDTHAKASNLKDDAGNVVQTVWSDDVRIETQTISSFNATSVTVSSAFSAAPNGEVIFTVTGDREEGGDVSGSTKQYIITSVSPDDKMIYSINAAEYHVEKYDAVDRGWVIPTYADIAQTPKRTDQIPVPRSVSSTIVPGSAEGGDQVGEGDTINDYSVVINWAHPKTSRTDSEGNVLDDVYEHLAGYNIQHNIISPNNEVDANREFTTVRINSNNKTDFTINQVVPGNYILRVQTVATNGQTSGWVQKLCVFNEALFTIFGAGTINAGLNGAIQKGGILTTVPTINSSNGTVTFANSTYVFSPPNGVSSVIVNSGNTAYTEQTFPDMSDGDNAYLMFDYDGNTARGTVRSDPLRPIKLVTESTEDADGFTVNYQYLARLGQSNNDISQANGTITTTAGEPEVTGSSTTFTTDYVEGDIMILDDAGTTRFMGRIMDITSDTVLTLDASPTRSYSGANTFKQNLPFDRMKDTIIGEVSLSGSTYSYTPFTNKQRIEDALEIAGNTITSTQLSGNAVQSIHIEANSIGAAAIVAGSINNSHISANSIGAANIIAGEIDSSHIAANSIGSVAIAANAIGDSEIAANSIGTVAIQAGSITSNEIGANSIGTVAIQADSITSNEIASNAIGTVAIQANSITAAQLTADAVQAFTVTANSITAVELAANSVGSSAIAANSISGIEISANAIGSSEISANSVNGTIIAGNSVGGTQIAANTVNGIILSSGAVDAAAKLADNIVINTKIAGNAVDTAQLLTGAVKTLQIAADAITNAKIAANAVNTSEIVSNAITNAQISFNSVNTSEIVSNAITGDLIAGNAVDTAQIKANSITSAAIVAGVIGSSEMAANSIGTANIISDAIDSSHISANSIGSTAIVAGAINSSHVAANSIGSAAIIAGTIGSSEMAVNSIGTANIIAGAIDSSHVSANSIGSTAIVAGAINSSHVAANSIGSTAIVAGSIGTSEIAVNSIGTAAIIAGSIDLSHVSANSIDTNQIVSGAIDSSHIQANSINSNMIVAGAINSSHVAANAITAVAVVAGSITNNEIAANTINSVVIDTGAVGQNQIAANAITNAKIQTGAVNNASIASGASISFAKINAANAITNAHIASNTIKNAQISATGGISFAKISVANGDIDGAKISTNGNINSAMIGSVSNTALVGTITLAQIGANSINAAKIVGGSITNAEIAGNTITNANIAGNTIKNAQISATSGIDFAKISVPNGSINNAVLAANVITNAKISSTDNMTITLTDGTAGGWNVNATDIRSATVVGGGDGVNTTTGLILSSASGGFISGKEFTIDSSGNAKFNGTLEGDDVTVNGTLVLPSDGGTASGLSIGGWSTNTMANKRLIEIGSGAGFYQGYVRLVGNTDHVKTVSIQVRTGTSNTSQGTLVYETPQLHQYTAGNLLHDGGTRIYSSAQTANMPIAFSYSGSSALSVYIRAQADTGLDYLGTCEARFLKFGTTDPVFAFANQAGAALSTAVYSNTQVTGGFAGTKTVNITNTSFTRFKIDNGSFGTANSQIANGSYINVEITSAATNLTTRSTTVTIGNTSQDFNVTTGGTTGGGGLPGGGGGGGCFVQGTPVVMADGTTKAIEDVTAGESVKSFRHSSLSLDENAWETWTASEIANGSFGTSNVVEVTDPHSYTNYYWINYNLKVTNEHPMLSFKNGVFKFVRVEDLVIGDNLVRENGTLEEIFAIPNITEACITHNMDVEDDDTYVVRGGNGTGYIAHNVDIGQKA